MERDKNKQLIAGIRKSYEETYQLEYLYQVLRYDFQQLKCDYVQQQSESELDKLERTIQVFQELFSEEKIENLRLLANQSEAPENNNQLQTAYQKLRYDFVCLHLQISQARKAYQLPPNSKAFNNGFSFFEKCKMPSTGKDGTCPPLLSLLRAHLKPLSLEGHVLSPYITPAFA